MVKLLIIDNESSFRNTLKDRLGYEKYEVEAVQTVAEGKKLISDSNFDVVICDQPTFETLSTMGNVGDWFCGPLIVMADVKTHRAASAIVNNGAYDVVNRKPCDLNLLFSIVDQIADNKITTQPSGAVVNASVAPKANAMARVSKQISARVEDLIGTSDSMVNLKKVIDKVAPSDARVLILGGNGTGKELVARWLHEKSRRSNMPFVEVNCAAIPSELIESELFGHEKGAFTSAVRQHKGKFEQAHGGTLFLDEIGDMSLCAQSKVLRVLQENRLSRVGSDSDLIVDVRVIAATNKNIRKEIEKGNFREDLYHRLSVIELRVPSLSERREDIPLLISHFMATISQQHGIAPKSIENIAMDELLNRGWSGNIRELHNVVERLLILCDNEITADDIKTYAGVHDLVM